MICIDSESTIKLIRVKASTVYCYGHWITRPYDSVVRCTVQTMFELNNNYGCRTGSHWQSSSWLRVHGKFKLSISSYWHRFHEQYLALILIDLISDAMRRSVTRDTITPAEWHHAWPLPVAAMHMAPFQKFYNQSHFIALFSSNFILLRAIFVITFGRGTHTGTIISVLHFRFAYSANNFSI